VPALIPPVVQAFGYRYPDGAVVREPGDDGELLEDPSAPTGRPGSRAPYVPLIGRHGPTSTTALFGHGFVLLTGVSGDTWQAAGDVAAERLGVEVTVHRITNTATDWTPLADPTGQWQHRYGIGPDGAVLVRPDRFVAWRSVGAGSPDDVVTALRRVLGR
jgi:hypothetical protein